MTWDFLDILSSLRDKLRLETNWRNIFFYGVIDALLKVIAWIIFSVKYVTDVYYRESNWGTMQLFKTAVSQSKILSFTPKRIIGAAGTINLSGSSTFSSIYTYTGNNVLIPKWTQFSDTSGTSNVYCSTATTYVTGTVGNLLISVKEGTPATYTYIAQGTVNETFKIIGENIENDVIEVFIVDSLGTVLYTVSICRQGTNVERLYFVNETTTYYCEINLSKDTLGIDIKFGDGVTSKKLTAGERILVKYATSKGVAGNITNTSVISKIKTNLTDILGNTATLYVTNSVEISNAEDAQDLEYTRNYAPRLWVSGYRAGGYSDWITSLEDHPYIHKASVVYDENDPANSNKVFVSAISSDGSDLTNAEKTTVSLYMKNKKSMTEIIEWKVLNIINLLFKINAKIITTQPTSTVSGEIINLLDNHYGILNTDFNTNIYESNYTALIDDLTDVIYHKTGLWHLEKNTDFSGESFRRITSSHLIKVSTTAAQNSVLENQILISPSTAEIVFEHNSGGVWETPYTIALDTGSGKFSGIAGFSVDPLSVNNKIDYINNEVSFSITTLADIATWGIEDVNYKLYLAYKTQDGNGEQINAVRFPESGLLITDVDTKFQRITLSY